MAIVKLILDVKDHTWIDSRPRKVLLLNEPCYREDGMVAYGDGTTELQHLIFKPIFSGVSGTVQSIITASSATPSATDIMVSVSDLAVDFTLNAPVTNSDAKQFILRVRDNGASRQIAFDIIYRFSNGIPAVSFTTPNATLYFHFIKNDVSGTWDCIGIEDKFGELIIPPPPYVRSSLSTITGLTQVAGNGPSNASPAFSVNALGLNPSSGNIIISEIPNNFEASDDNGITWGPGPFAIPYSLGKVNTPAKYKVRAVGSLSAGDYSGEIIFSCPDANADIINISVSATITASSIYHPDAIAYFNECSGPLSDYFKTAVNNLITRLDLSGSWIKIKGDFFGLYCTENRSDATINLADPSGTRIQEVNNPDWLALRGYKSDGATSYLNLKYNPSNGVNFKIDKNSYGFYVLESGDDNFNTLGGYDGSVFDFIGQLVVSHNIYNNNSSFLNIAGTGQTGLNCVVRKDLNTIQSFYKHPTSGAGQSAERTSVSVAVANIEMYSIGWNAANVAQLSSSGRRVMDFFGGEIDPVVINNALVLFFQDIGAV